MARIRRAPGRGTAGRPRRLFALRWLAACLGWLALAAPVAAAGDVARLSDVVLNPRIAAIVALLVVAAWLGFADRWRAGHHRR